MRIPRISSLAVVTTLSLSVAISANAASLTLNIQNVFSSGMGISPTAIVGPSSIQNLTVGDFIQLSVDIENSGADVIQAVFATLMIDPAMVSLSSSSFATSILFVPATGFPTFTPEQSLARHGAGPVVKVTSLPAGDQIQAFAFSSGWGSVGTGPDIAASTIILEVIAPGSTGLTLGFFFSNDVVQLNGPTFAGPAAAALVPINNPVIAISTTGSSINDADGDLVLDLFDNCRFVANGPHDASNQVNTNAGSDHPSVGEVGDVCDADFNDDGFVNGADIALWIGTGFNSGNLVYDLDGDGFVDGPDQLLINFNGLPGPGPVALDPNAVDTDGDLIPDLYDNCLWVPNGPGDASNQGNANFGSDYAGPPPGVAGELGNVCDADFNDDGIVDGPDIELWISTGFNTTNLVYDLNGDGFVDAPDFVLINFNGFPGPGASTSE